MGPGERQNKSELCVRKSARKIEALAIARQTLLRSFLSIYSHPDGYVWVCAYPEEETTILLGGGL